MRKVVLIFARSEMEPILTDLILLGSLDVTAPTLLIDDPELPSAVKAETISLEHYDANRESLTMLATDFTFYLTGWIAAKSEQGLVAAVSKYTCAWEFEDPSPAESENIPKKLYRPKFLYRFYKGSAVLFSPLMYCKT